jgi:[glutamine synthetase] adenylyltransferase / [glutamine synthetase]-adenylyl-L-tyrosine phosphorylase
LRHEPAILAGRGATHPAEASPPPELLLAELERRCLNLRPIASGERLERLHDRLEDFAALADSLIVTLAASGPITAADRRGFAQAYAALEAGFDAVEAPRAAPFGDAFDDIATALPLMAALAPIRDLAAHLRTSLSRALNALFHPGLSDPVELRLADAGFADPVRAARRLRQWWDGVPAALQDPAERAALDRVLPRMIATLERFADPDEALAALDEIVGRLPAGTLLFTPFGARPSLMDSVLGLLGHAPDLSRHLIAQPGLIGRLIDSSAFAPLPLPGDLDAEFARLLEGDDRMEGPLRIAKAIEAHRFGLGLQLLEATADPLDIALSCCTLAEAGVRAMADEVLARMRETHGVVPGAELVILALGRFGGRALTAQSDLDIIYLFTGDCRAQSDGRRPLDANEYFSRVAQQVTMALSVVTPMGPLYEVDTRLRPWGAKGMLACSVETFDRYHQDNAWTWEHMALARARPVYGSDGARKAVKALVDRRLRQPRDRDALLRDAVKMRADIARHKPARGEHDVKLVRGGLVDLEFAVHVNQLGHHVGIHPRLRTALRSQVAAGLIDPMMVEAHETLSRMLIALRLLSPHSPDPAPEQRPAIARACGFDDWDALEAAYGQARIVVEESWHAVIMGQV